MFLRNLRNLRIVLRPYMTDCVPLMLEVVRHAGHDDALFEKQRAFQEQRTLIVEQLLPPPGGNKLWQHHGHKPFTVFSPQAINVTQQRTRQFAIW